jgi:hypothetical protein
MAAHPASERTDKPMDNRITGGSEREPSIPFYDSTGIGSFATADE